MYVDSATRRKRVLLRAANSIDNIGLGAAELRGQRTTPRFMRARQRIYGQDGSEITVRTGARLEFKLAHLGQRWWKFYKAAAFRLYRLDGAGQPLRLVRTGPKMAYCLRDLSHTRPGRRGSPRRRVYPACKTDPFITSATIGTSVGWSDNG